MVVLPKYGSALLPCGVGEYRLGVTWSRDGVELVEESVSIMPLSIYLYLFSYGAGKLTHV